MEYAEYKKILDNGMVDYVNSGGSTFYIGNATKEYFFTYAEEPIAEDDREYLSNKAIQAIMRKDKLPPGIRLVKCVWHTGR